MRLFLFFIGAAFILCAAIGPAHANSANLMIRSIAGGDRFCMDADGNRQADGTKVFIYRCHGRENQRWAVTLDVDGTSAIIGTGGLCLDVRSQGRSDGTPVQLWKCHFQANQRFRVETNGTIHEVQSNKCLFAKSQADGAPIVLDDCKGSPQERWEFAH